MRKVIVRAPVRADLAGGTLDLWPIYLFHPGSRTINVAISYYAEAEVQELSGSEFEIHLSDQQYHQRYGSLHEMESDPKAALVFRAVEHFHLSGLSIITRTDAPRGSGLGGSSALAIALVRALSEFAGEPVEGDALIALVRDLETRLLGVPAGIQDYYPPVYGGLSVIRLEPGFPVRHSIPLPITDLADHLVLHYTGVAHFSGTNNWQMYKRQIEGKKKIRKGFANIAATSQEMERALESGNFQAAGAALRQEWHHRKALIDGISTPEIDAAIDAALGAGAWGGKVCGAGGGGCIIFLTPKERRADVIAALADVPGRVLEAVPVSHGLTVSTDDAQAALFSVRSKGMQQPSSTRSDVEEFFVAGGSGAYRPHLLADGIVTLREPRSGAHQTIVRSFVAPLRESDGCVLWDEAFAVDPDMIDMRLVPDEDRAIPAQGAASEAVAQSEEGFREFLTETRRLRIFYNEPFGLYSTPQESREAFVERCMEEATRRIGDETERLESTFRRRLDQVRERSERDQRELDAQDTDESEKERRYQQVNVAWGQALYNITSGRPAAVAETHSVREVDYLERIAEIQKAWDRELQTLRDEMTRRAHDIQELEITPSARDIEVARCALLWI
ncbi:MAG TPA: hypothetical protein VFL80_03985 [Thermoanaerobaculia bacterium]|nr:hypothetical protein [Thermoanaerobaculia bacterium]